MSAAKITHRHSPLFTIVLHLLPGVAITVVGGIAAYLLRDRGVPAYFILELCVLAVMIPTMGAIMVWARNAEGKTRTRDLLMRTARKLRAWEYVAYPVIVVAFAAAVFTLIGDPLSSFFKQLLVPDLPRWADLNHVFTHPDAYDEYWPVVCWALGAVLVTFVGPIAEELYFRGYLLPRIPGPPVLVVAAGAVLFALYHVFSIWMVPVRAIALIPLVYIVWRTRSVTIGIISHCALNLVGDTIGLIPVVFG